MNPSPSPLSQYWKILEQSLFLNPIYHAGNYFEINGKKESYVRDNIQRTNKQECANARKHHNQLSSLSCII